MDGTTAAELQRDEQAEETMPGAIHVMVEGMLKDVNTILPGIVRSFDPATQTVRVQAALQTVFVGVGATTLPECVDVPVVFPAGGNFVLTFPVTAGDECLLMFSQRAIDFWWDQGGVQLPSEVRFHDLSDAFALVGVSSRPRFLSGVATDAVELRTRAGDTVLRIENEMVTAGAVAGAEKSIKADTYRGQEDQVFDSILSALTAIGSGLSALGYAAAATAIADVGTKLLAFHAQAPQFVTQKVKVF